MFTTEKYTAEISTRDYLEGYVDVEGFLECCKQCPNYGKTWSCPPFDFAPEEFWKQYERFELTAVKIIFDEEYGGRKFPKEEMDKIMKESIGRVKQELSQELLAEEKRLPGSISLSAGSCSLCGGNCAKQEEKPCRFPEQMRYSIEALGGNVGMTIEKLMGLKLEWMEDGTLPHYFVLVCGMLRR